MLVVSLLIYYLKPEYLFIVTILKRSRLWISAINMIKDYPWTGVGFET